MGAEISATAHRIGGGVTGFEITKVANVPSGGGTSYMGTIEGVHVYSCNAMSDKALLCSRRFLRGISYGIVHGRSDVVDFWFVEGEDPEKSRVRLKLAQRIEWADDVLVEFDIAGIAQA